MPECEVCGKETSARWLIRVDNSKLMACRDCSSHGTLIKKERIQKKTKKPVEKKKVKKRSEKKELTPNYTDKIKKARESRGLSQEQLAKKINEHESRVRKIEKGKMKPTPKIADKLEKELKIKIYQKPEKIETKITQKKKEKVTIGDIIKLKSE